MKVFEIYDIVDLAPNANKCLDRPAKGAYVSDTEIPFSGWAYLPEGIIEKIFIKNKDIVIDSVICDIPRPKLKKKVGANGAAPLGFKSSITAEAFFNERFELVLSAKIGDEELPLWKLLGRQSENYSADLLSKKLFYMHIAKTAGTSVNSFIYNHYPHGSCREHIEAIHLNKATRKEVLENKLYLSGHITLDVALSSGFIDNSFKKFTILRSPMDQLLSHLSWVKRLSFHENRKDFESHPWHIQEIALRLGRLSLEDFVLSMTPTEKDLFDNVQTRYLSSTFHRKLSLEDKRRALENLGRFDVLGISERLADSLKLLSSVMGWEKSVSTPPRENVSQYKISKLDLTEKDFEVLGALTCSDRIVYHRALELFETQYAKNIDP